MTPEQIATSRDKESDNIKQKNAVSDVVKWALKLPPAVTVQVQAQLDVIRAAK